MLIHSAEITGSVQFNNTDVSGITNVSSFATTASVDAVVIKTGSFATTSSVNELQSKTGSYATTSSVNELQSKTGSYTSTSSFGAYSSSINTFTSSANTRLNTIESVTGSYASTSSVNNLQSVTGSYASTGSNQFNGNQSISGSIVSNGTITAQTLVVQTVTSSIEFVTGSTRNGSLSSNTHQFTGSVLMTGSLTVNKVAINAGNLTLSNFPTLDLIISGGIGFTSGGGASALVNRDGSGNITFYGSSGDIKFTDVAMTSNYLTIKNAGNVGIGTSSPVQIAHLQASGTSYLHIGNSSTGASSSDGCDIGYFSGETLLNIVQRENDAIALSTSGSERMRITSTGNVGISTTSPSQKLSLGSPLGIASSATTYGSNDQGSIMWSYEFSGTFPRHLDIISAGSPDGTNGGGNIRFFTNPVTNASNSVERMRITSDGNVAIGNTSPSTKLHVTGVITANELILAGGGSWGYTTDSNWSSHQLIIPSGTLSGGGVYLIRIQYGSGSPPYIVYATGLWQPVQSNGGSADAEVQLLSSSHQGVGTAIFIRNQSVGGQNTSALYARLSNFPSTVGSLTATATRLM
jgi:hypothetical protein